MLIRWIQKGSLTLNLTHMIWFWYYLDTEGIDFYGEPQNLRWDIPGSIIIKAMHSNRTSYAMVSINK